MVSIPLHPEYGVSPHLCFCPRCGKDNNEIALTGAYQKKKCRCGVYFVGPSKGGCPACGETEWHELMGVPSPNEKLMGGLCDQCKEEIKMVKEEIAAGGVPFKCEKCGTEGVIKHDTETAKYWKEKLTEYPDKAGIKFPDCPLCRRES